MKHLKALFIAVVCILISIFVFTLVQSLDLEFVLGNNSSVRVHNNNHAHTKKEIEKSITEFAKKEKMNIIYATPNLSRRTQGKDIYVFEGNPDENIDIGSFNPKAENKLLSEKEFNTKDMRGQYFFQEKIDPQKVKDLFASNGLAVDIFNMNYLFFFAQHFIDSKLSIGLLSVLLTFLILSFHGVVHKFKEYSIKKMMGHSFFKIYCHDFIGGKWMWITSCFLVYIGTIIALLLLGYHAQLLFFSKLLFAAYGMVLLVLLFIDLFSYLLLAIVDVPKMVKGAKPYRFSSLFNNASKIMIVLFVGAVFAQNAGLLHALDRVEDSKEMWAKIGDYYSVDIAPVRNTEEDQVFLEKLK